MATGRMYRMGGVVVHARGTKLPEACVAAVGIAGAPRKRGPENWGASGQCMAPSGYLCDWPVRDGKTCDRALCGAHATPVGKNRHFCPEHHAEQKAAQRQLGLFTSLVHGQKENP